MRRLTIVLAFALVGCADSDKKGDDATPPPASTAQPKPQPAAQPKPQPAAQPKPQPAAAAQPAEAPPSDDVVIIKGSKHRDSSGSSGSSSSSRQAKIEELNAKAKASQGKDNGQPLKPSDSAATVDADVKKERLKAQIADKDAQLAKLDEEKKSLVQDASHREGRRRVHETKVADPERVAAIDLEVENLKKEKFVLQQQLAELEAAK